VPKKTSPKSSPRLRVLVTAGPTRERIDPVRFLSNDSSGRMGFAIAEAAARAGHEVVLVAGPVALETPKGVRRVDVESAREMLAACKSEWRACDALFMAAAVADWRPAKRLAGKWRAKDGGATSARIDLIRNPDVLATLTGGERHPERIVVAFALETGDGERRARAKLAKKGADWIVLNGPDALNAESTRLVVLGANGMRIAIPERAKKSAARDLLALLL
jgi:phosphopantothenoylcysteine decarboxylase/phosphopantothenate--cysteine ligase